MESLPPLFLSARTEAALRATAEHYVELLKGKSPQEFYDIAHAAAYRREQMEKDWHCIPARWIQQSICSIVMPKVTWFPGFLSRMSCRRAGSGFVYSGNGTQWAGMGRALLAESPRFKEILSEIDEIMLPQAGFSLITELEAEDTNSRLDDTRVAQPLLLPSRWVLPHCLESRVLSLQPLQGTA